MRRISSPHRGGSIKVRRDLCGALCFAFSLIRQFVEPLGQLEQLLHCLFSRGCCSDPAVVRCSASELRNGQRPEWPPCEAARCSRQRFPFCYEGCNARRRSEDVEFLEQSIMGCRGSLLILNGHGSRLRLNHGVRTDLDQ